MILVKIDKHNNETQQSPKTDLSINGNSINDSYYLKINREKMNYLINRKSDIFGNKLNQTPPLMSFTKTIEGLKTEM